MGDLFKEQIVKKIRTTRDSLKAAAIIAAGIVLAFAAIMFFGVGGGLVITFIIAFAVFYLINRLNIEYEYAYTNGYLDIDCIYNRSKRKNLFSGVVSEFDIMAHIDDKERFAVYEQLKTKDYSSGEILGNTYVFVSRYKGSKMKFIIEPNEEILSAMLHDLTPRKLFKKVING